MNSYQIIMNTQSISTYKQLITQNIVACFVHGPNVTRIAQGSPNRLKIGTQIDFRCTYFAIKRCQVYRSINTQHNAEANFFLILIAIEEASFMQRSLIHEAGGISHKRIAETDHLGQIIALSISSFEDKYLTTKKKNWKVLIIK